MGSPNFGFLDYWILFFGSCLLGNFGFLVFWIFFLFFSFLDFGFLDSIGAAGFFGFLDFWFFGEVWNLRFHTWTDSN